MVRHPVPDAEILAQIPRAEARARVAGRTQPHAESARYDRRTRTLHVKLTNGSAFAIPVTLIGELANATDAELAKVAVGAAGIGLHWENLDIDLSVPGLARLVLGTRTLLRAAGEAGGRARSPAKAKAARQNGKLGGRPPKATSKSGQGRGR